RQTVSDLGSHSTGTRGRHGGNDWFAEHAGAECGGAFDYHSEQDDGQRDDYERDAPAEHSDRDEHGSDLRHVGGETEAGAGDIGGRLSGASDDGGTGIEL